jgi:hypothetical protein
MLGSLFYFLQEDFDRPALEMAVKMISTMDFSPPPFLKEINMLTNLYVKIKLLSGEH